MLVFCGAACVPLARARLIRALGCFAKTLRRGEIVVERLLGRHARITSGDTLPMKRVHIATLLVYALLWPGCGSVVQPSAQNGGASGDDSATGRAFKTRTSNIQVEGEGVVTRILADDLDGSRHQRFIIRLESGQTVLIAHNIDLAPRVAGLQEGGGISFYGEYVWNEQGGKIHWTHHDPEGRHVAGWLKYNGRTYQ
jgi:hypothetical protein